MVERVLIKLLVSIALLIGTASCGQRQQQEQVRRDFVTEADGLYNICVSKEDCYLCGGKKDALYWECLGQNNVGIVSLNSFQLIPVEINRYDAAGKLIEENVGYTKTSNIGSKDEGFSAYLTISPDRGTSNAEIIFYSDKELNLENTARHLCENHFHDFVSDLYGSPYGIGIINFEKAKIFPLNDNIISRQTGDYYIHCDPRKYGEDGKAEEMAVYIIYTPLRYENEA